ncbi:MAG: ABC transporter ATP-binding protein [Thaumarchaeota archaeon]|nr:ABC transporter ATP-binding protein [Nitrososphaerota archaeon]
MLEGIRISKRFGGLLALRDVDFCVYDGEILGLIGPNGAGKTTLFNVVTGEYAPTSGTVRFDGVDITGFKPYEICKMGIARTFQTPKPFSQMTVYENLLAASIFGRSKSKNSSNVRSEIDQILDRFSLTNKRLVLASELPLYEQRLLEIARALATKPKLLLLDEVMAGLNPKETIQASNIIQHLREDGITIFIIEHNMRAIMKLSNRVLVLNQGMKIAEGKPDEVSKDASVIEAYLGEAYVRG